MKPVSTVPQHTLDKSVLQVIDLFERYQGAIFAYLFRLVNERDLAHDLAQDVFEKVYIHRHQLAEVKNPRAWIYRIATNMALNAQKRRRRFTWLPWQNDEDAVWAVQENTAELDEKSAVAAALVQLPAKYRSPLLLYSSFDFNVREIAEVLNISEGAVKNRLYRAREMFRQVYGGEAE